MPFINAYQFAEASPRVYLTLADCRADTDLPGPEDGPELAVITGSADPFDGDQGGLFAWNKDSVAADNGSTVIQPTATTGDGRWIQICAIVA